VGRQFVTATNDQMHQAVQEGRERYRICQEKSYKAYGGGSITNHINGRLAELVFPGWFDGSEPQDPSYQTDIQNGKCDFIDKEGRKWGIRSRRQKGEGLLVKPNDPFILYVNINTAEAPILSIDGWMDKTEVIKNYQLEPMRCNQRYKIYEVPRDDLHPFLPRSTPEPILPEMDEAYQWNFPYKAFTR